MTPSIVILAGGVGGAKFVIGVREHARRTWPDGSGGTTARLTVIANTGDDAWVSGVRIQPDIDSLIYALAGVNDTERGWGRAGESERVSAELRELGAGWPWFTLGDLDLGTHLARTGWLRDGVPVHEITARLAARWPIGVRILPMTDSEVDTHVILAAADASDSLTARPAGDGRVAIHFQEWWTRYRARIPALGFEQRGITAAAPAPGVLEAIAAADLILIAPSNPVVSIGPILAVPGIADAVRSARASVVGVSPIIGGRVVRGMADACLSAIGIATAADAVGRHYGARTLGILDAWLIAEEDADLAAGFGPQDPRIHVAPLWMSDLDAAAALASAAFAAGGIRA